MKQNNDTGIEPTIANIPKIPSSANQKKISTLSKRERLITAAPNSTNICLVGSGFAYLGLGGVGTIKVAHS